MCTYTLFAFTAMNYLQFKQDLGSKAMRPRHWEQLFTVLDQPQYPDMTSTLSELLDIGVLAQAQLVSQLCTAATGEAKLEDSLKVCISCMIIVKDAFQFGKVYTCVLHEVYTQYIRIGHLVTQVV
jgi:Dynein heavy chain, N-terminal region 2